MTFKLRPAKPARIGIKTVLNIDLNSQYWELRIARYPTERYLKQHVIKPYYNKADAYK